MCKTTARAATSDFDLKFAQYIHTAEFLNSANYELGVKPCLEDFKSLSPLMSEEDQTVFQRGVGSVTQAAGNTCGCTTWTASGSMDGTAPIGPVQGVGALRCIHGSILSATLNRRAENCAAHFSMIDDVHRNGGRVEVPVIDMGCIFGRWLLANMDRLLSCPEIDEATKAWLRDIRDGKIRVLVGGWHIMAHVWACLSKYVRGHAVRKYLSSTVVQECREGLH
jgi:hypothetical protein